MKKDEVFEKAIHNLCTHEDDAGNWSHPREYCDDEIKEIIENAREDVFKELEAIIDFEALSFPKQSDAYINQKKYFALKKKYSL